MTMRKIKDFVLLTLLLIAPSAWAETIDCTPITTLPYTITTQGIYCFTGNLATSMAAGTAISINTNNVTIDLNGWKLGGLAAGDGTTSNGIYAFQRKNITIRNGIIRGFRTGINLQDNAPFTASQGHLIEDIRADQNTWIGILVKGRGNTVRRNQVVDTGGTTVSSGYAFGINLWGPGARILNNDISSTVATGAGIAYGLYLNSGNGAVAEGNRIDEASSDTGATFGVLITGSNDVVVEDNRISGLSTIGGTTFGIYFMLSNDVLAAGNRITSAGFGIAYNSATGKYMDNLTSNVAAPFTNGTSVGNNN